MNEKYYADIFELFKRHHPYMINDVAAWHPKGENGVRITMRDGVQYDFYSVTKSIRRVDDRPVYNRCDASEEEWRKVFADRLQEYMVLKGFSQNTLAEYTGLGKGSIYNYVNGKATPSGYALHKLTQALGCYASDLVD